MIESLRAWAARTDELFDNPEADAPTLVASLRDIARINRAFGGTSAAVGRLSEFWSSEPRGARLTLLDAGTGAGDIPAAARAAALKRGIHLTLVGLDRFAAAARESSRSGALAALVGDGGQLPFADRSVDLVLCAKLLHHLPGPGGTRLLRELDRVARRAVVVADIRRSAVAALGIWLASFPMRFHPATRRDGVISVFRGFSPAELARACRTAGFDAVVKRHPGWCLTAAWRPLGRT
jgi:ubiquinone/menaquinone biosynthesis C-methylase UbiE